jgi:hypothetical protein
MTPALEGGRVEVETVVSISQPLGYGPVVKRWLAAGEET